MYVSTALFNGLVFVVRCLRRLSFSYNEERLGGCYTDLDCAVLLHGDGQHVQLYLQDLWFSVDVCGPPLVLHTSEQVATVGTDRACLAHRLGSL